MAMDVREKLVELLDNAIIDSDDNYGFPNTNQVADRLIANGVTVQEWIPVKDRMPENSGFYLVLHQDKYDRSASIAIDYYVMCGAGEWWANEFTHNITHWMPLPEPPKGE